jgi:PhnB protein
MPDTRSSGYGSQPDRQGMNNSESYIQRGFGAVRPYLQGPESLPDFLREVFGAIELERNENGPVLMQIADSLLWIEAGELPSHIAPWLCSTYVYCEDVDAAYARALALGAKSISPPEDKPWNERQAGFTDAAGAVGFINVILWIRLRGHNATLATRCGLGRRETTNGQSMMLHT